MQSIGNVTAFILAGGEGRRIWPLTRDRAKPAVPFLDLYRMMDFVFSNLYWSGYRDMHILSDYKDNSLIRHAKNGYAPRIGKTIEDLMLPSAAETPAGRYIGTADAIAKNLHVIERKMPEHVLVFNADHTYVMDVKSMHQQHLGKKADITIAAVRVPTPIAALNFGVLNIDEKGRVTGFDEKPAHPRGIPGDPGHCLASMGNYIFSTDVLLEEIMIDSRKTYTKDTTEDFCSFTQHDLARNIIASAHRNGRTIYAYDHSRNAVEGAAPGYWRDVGTIDQYFLASQELLRSHPPIDLYGAWSILTCLESEAPVFIDAKTDIRESRVAPGCDVRGIALYQSSVSYETLLENRVTLTNTHHLGHGRIGHHSRLTNAIVDRKVVIPPYTAIGEDKGHDLERGFTVSSGGVTVVPRGYVFEE